MGQEISGAVQTDNEIKKKYGGFSPKQVEMIQYWFQSIFSS